MRTFRRRTPAAVAVLAVSLAAAGVADGAAVKNAPLSTWGANGTVHSEIVVGNVAYLGGSFTSMLPPGSTGSGAVTRNGAAALNLDTGALLSWNPNVTGGPVYSLFSRGSNVYLGGGFKSVGGKTHKYIAEVNGTSGSVVTAFHPPSPNKAVRGFGASGGSLYIGGSFTKLGGATKSFTAKLDATSGALDSTWAPVVNGEVHAIALNPSGTRVVLGGFFNTLNGASSISVGAVDPATGASLPWTWTGPFSSSRPFQVLAFAQDGSTLFGAGTGNGGSAMSWDIETGNLNYIEGFNGNVVGIGVVDGILYAGGHYTGYCGAIPGNNFCAPAATRNKLSAFDEHTGALQSWNPTVNMNLGIYTLAAGHSSVVIGGDFTKVAGQTRQKFAQFHE